MEYHENEPAEFQIDDSYSVPVSILIKNTRFLIKNIFETLGCGYCCIRNDIEGCN